MYIRLLPPSTLASIEFFVLSVAMSSDNIIPPEDAMLYLVNVHRRLFLRKAFGINPDGTPIPNIEEFNDAPIKTYRDVKTLAQYNEIVRVLMQTLTMMTLSCPRSGGSARQMKPVGTTTMPTLNSCTPRTLMALQKLSCCTRIQIRLSSICWTSLTSFYQHTINKVT